MKQNKKSSIKTRLIVVPLIVVMIGVIGIAAVSSFFTRLALTSQMRDNGHYTIEQFFSRQDDTTRALELIDFIKDEGISNSKIEELASGFSYQLLLDEIADSELVEYAQFFDNSLMIVASSNQDEIGTFRDDEGSKAAGIDGIPYSGEKNYELGNSKVYEIIVPAFIHEQHIGAVSIGYSMARTEAAIKISAMIVIATACFVFIILGLVLFSSSNYAIKIINRLKEQMGILASGDFSQDISEDLLSKKDEFGQMSQAVSAMQNAVKDALRNAMEASEQLAASSQELTATSEQSATAADEVAKVIEDIAQGAADQAKETEQGVLAISVLGDLVMKNKGDIENLNSTTEKVNELKDQGLEILRELVEKTNINSKSSKEVQQIIINTNESAERIASASEMIKSIAGQTNLLALNAAIEAARAGDAGRGFAVVADEIRKLAEQSDQFTNEISTIITDLTDKTSDAVQTMEALEEVVLSQSESVGMTSNKFDGIADAIEEMKAVINQVNSSSDEMANKKEEIISIIEQLSAISEENAAGTQQASASVEEQTASMGEIAHSSDELARIAEELNQEIGKFRI